MSLDIPFDFIILRLNANITDDFRISIPKEPILTLPCKFKAFVLHLFIN